MFNKLQRLFHTIIWLKPVQFLARPFYAFKRKFFRIVQFSLASRKEFSLSARELKLRLSGISDEFSFKVFNKTLNFNKNNLVWVDLNLDKLTRYQLNYFDFLIENKKHNALKDNLYLILDWIEKNQNELSETWEPYPASRRLCRWISWIELNKSELSAFPSETNLILKCIFNQLKRLKIDIEDHLLGNHLFADLKALFIVSGFLLRTRFFKLTETNKRYLISIRNYSSTRLKKEIRNQFLPDGAHEERSPVYHNLMSLDLKEILADSLLYPMKPRLLEFGKPVFEKAFLWSLSLTHPDGSPALFGDSAFNAFPNADKIEFLFRGLSPISGLFNNNASSQINLLKYSTNESIFHTDSGYFVFKNKNTYFALCAGEPGPPHQPGHAHCDILSYELSVFGNRLVVDTGCGSYQNRLTRILCRSTSAHNVPMIEGTEQSDAWGEFRMGKRAKVISQKHFPDKNLFLCRFSDISNNVFERKVTYSEEAIKISDSLLQRASSGNFVSIIHLAPGWTAKIIDQDIILRLPALNSQKIVLKCCSCKIRTINSKYFPEFGDGIENQTLLLSADDKSGIIEYSFELK
ncbi:MAG: alginate lyase family protein [Candidatus Riflebacteria bacterium]|nr:alginate lyase family protein [Candidatus Riflebacteria bacterium]